MMMGGDEREERREGWGCDRGCKEDAEEEEEEEEEGGEEATIIEEWS